MSYALNAAARLPLPLDEIVRLLSAGDGASWAVAIVAWDGTR